MDLSYLLTPLLAWLVAGSLKFLINSCRAGKPAFGLIGYGGMPSNHSAIVSSMAALVALKHGIDHPAFGVALALAFIVVLDASSLRRQVGKHAQAINRLHDRAPDAAPTATPLRERMGHSFAEILGGVVCGILLAGAVHAWLPLYD
jgi:acid phosphatase family membrane protein YuiD